MIIPSPAQVGKIATPGIGSGPGDYPLVQHLPEQCHPLDFECIQRNELRQQANMALLQERNRQYNYETCIANAYLNPPGPVRDQMLANCRQYATPIEIPSAPGPTVTLTYAETSEGEAIWVPQGTSTSEYLQQREELRTRTEQTSRQYQQRQIDSATPTTSTTPTTTSPSTTSPDTGTAPDTGSTADKTWLWIALAAVAAMLFMSRR